MPPALELNRNRQLAGQGQGDWLSLAKHKELRGTRATLLDARHIRMSH
jgi:hypothetical protein